MKKRPKIVTLDISIPIGSAANAAIAYNKKLLVSGYKKVRGFIISETTGPGVAYDVSLERTTGQPIIDPVNSAFIKLQSGVRPDENMLTMDFDLPNEDTIVKIIPKAITTQIATIQAIFLLTED